MSAETHLVVGLGKSGLAAARLVDALGGRALVTDDADVHVDLPGRAERVSAADAAATLGSVSAVVTSPGVPAGHPLLVAARDRGIAVLSELAFAAAHVEAPLLALTGTNGKSTVTSLVAAILAREALRVFSGGNLGNPLSDAAAVFGEHYDFCVVEVSSFQLEWPGELHPGVAAVLNVSPDHLDRHGDMATYVATKMRLFAQMTEDDFAVFGSGQPWWRAQARELRPVVSTFGADPPPPGVAGSAVDAGSRRLRSWSAGHRGADDPLWDIALGERWPLAPYDLDNVAAAAEIARLAGAGRRAIERATETFEPLAHRLCCVGTHAGVDYWNDSKATNVGATVRSLEAFAEPVILLVGGVAKGADFSPLRDSARRVRCAITYGAAADQIGAALSGATEVDHAAGLDQAFALAADRAQPGEVVLLAPACASFDEFADYAARGRRFEELVDGLGATSAVRRR